MLSRHSTYRESTSDSSTAVDDESVVDSVTPPTPPTPPGYDDYYTFQSQTHSSTHQPFDDHSLETLFNTLNAEYDQQKNQRYLDTDRLRSRSSTIRNAFIDEEKMKPTPPAPVGFWHSGLSQTRKQVGLKYARTLLVLCVAIVGILSIYWGVIFNVKQNMPRVSVAVVSFESLSPDYTPIVGPIVRRHCEAEVASRYDHLGYFYPDPSEYDNDPMQVRLAVYNEDIWAAIIINQNATQLLQEAVATGNTTYDPRGAASIVYNQARDVESYNFHIIPVLEALALTIVTDFGRTWAQQVFSNTSLNAATYTRSPQALSPGISFTMLNLRPFDPPAAIPTITIGLIYLIIIAFFSFTFFIPTHMKFILPNPASPHPPLKFYQLIIYRWLATITAYFFLSLSYSLVSLAFRIPFSNTPPTGGWSKTEPVLNANPFGHATWLVYWMLNFIGMAALGLACENMAMLLSVLSPLPYSALFLIFWVITNVSTGFYALELASDFYKWGYAWPLRHIVQGSKTLVFGTKDTLGLDFGVLFAWVGVSTALFPVACWVMRWKSLKDRQKAAAASQKV